MTFTITVASSILECKWLMPPEGNAEVARRDVKRSVSRLHQTVGRRPPYFEN